MNRTEIEAHVRALYATFASGDADAYRRAFADDIVWHVPGDNPVSGEYRGEAYFTTMLDRMAPLDAWGITVHDVLVNERALTAVVAFHLVGDRRGVHVELDGFHLVRLDAAGRIVEGWGFTADQDALDAFFHA